MFKKIYIEITNNCNLNCNFCIKNSRPRKNISISEFKILINKLKGHTKYLYFHILGEPLIHPNINDLINIASKDFNINITTNGYFLKNIKDNKNIRQLNISLHSFDNKYKKNLSDYLNDIFNTVDILKDTTIIKYRLWTKNTNSKEIIEYLNKKYNKVITNNCKLDNNIYFEKEEEFIWPSLDNQDINVYGSCLGTKTHIGILVDGTVVPCCLDSKGIINLGNIYKQELNDIINNDLFREIKKGFQNNKKIHPLCQRCNFYNMRNNKK